MSFATNCKSHLSMLEKLPPAASARNDLISSNALNSGSFMSSTGLLTSRSTLVKLLFTNTAARLCLPRTRSHWFLTSVFRSKSVSASHALLDRMTTPPRPAFFVQALLDFCGMPPTRHNDEAITIHETRCIHVINTHSEEAPGWMSTSRITFPPPLAMLTPLRSLLAWYFHVSVWPGLRREVCSVHVHVYHDGARCRRQVQSQCSFVLAHVTQASPSSASLLPSQRRRLHCLVTSVFELLLASTHLMPIGRLSVLSTACAHSTFLAHTHTHTLVASKYLITSRGTSATSSWSSLSSVASSQKFAPRQISG